MKDQPTLTLPLTPEQKEQIRKATGKQVETLHIEALEGRLAPGMSTN